MAKKRSPKAPLETAGEAGSEVTVRAQEIEYQGDYGAIPKHYVNNTMVTTNLYDCKFVFGQIVGNDGGKLTIAPEVIVYMSPQHAKVLVSILSSQLERYEARNGPIPATRPDAT